VLAPLLCFSEEKFVRRLCLLVGAAAAATAALSALLWATAAAPILILLPHFQYALVL